MASKDPVVEAEPDTTAPEPAPEPPFNAVIVVKNIDAEGNIVTEVVPNGDVRPTEVETLLKLGLQRWQRQLGL